MDTSVTRVLCAAVLVVAACHQSPVQPCVTAGLSRIASNPQPPAPSPPFDSIFRAAGAEFHVSPALLAGVTIEATRRDPVANIRAGAALLAAYAADAGGDWDAAAARFSGIDLAAGRAAYLAAVAGAQGVARSAQAATACPPPDTTAALDFPSAIWRPSPNFDQRAADSTGVPHIVIIHTCESNYASCWSWLDNPASQVSAHYVVNEDGSEISQLVREQNRAWHIAALYDCTLNRRHECWRNGVQSNHFTVGVEHAGFA